MLILRVMIESKLKDRLQKRLDIKNEIYSNLVAQASSVINEDFLTNYHLPQDFDFSEVDDRVFAERTCQTIPVPLDESVFNKFLNIEKKIINLPFTNKSVHGCYLVGNDNGKPILFALSIVKKSDIDYNIKLDVLVGGKEWLPLCRLDTFGPSHPNYFNSDKILDVPQRAPTPHLYINNQLTEILCYDDLDYTTANYLPSLAYENNQENDSPLIKRAINYFFEATNINAPINEKIIDSYDYDSTNPLFDYTKISFAEFGFELYDDNLLIQGEKHDL